MASGLCRRCTDPGRCREGTGAPCFDNCRTGATGPRRGLHSGVPGSLSRRPTSDLVPGTFHQPSSPGATICTTTCTFPCSGGPVLSEGAGDIELKEEGEPAPYQSKNYSHCGPTSIPQASPKVPSEAEGGGRWPAVKDACGDAPLLELDNRGADEFNGKKLPAGDRRTKKPDSRHEVLHGATLDFETTMTHSKWCGMLAAMVLRSRSPFSIHLQRSFRLHRSPMTSAPTLYPIPLPYLGIFDRMSPDMSVRERRQVSIRRAVYIMVFALNYWYYGGPPPDMEKLGRAPTSAQFKILRRVESFLRTDQGMDSFKISKAGRKFPQLVARIGELSESMTRLGLQGDQYTKTFAGAGSSEVEVPELQPYRDLQADRLRLFGRAHWDISPYLSDELIMGFREPQSLLVDRIPEEWEFPKCNDSYEEILSLAALWDSQDLLFVHNDQTIFERPFEKVRIFNAYKNQEMDRQIGDRRGRNAVEHKLQGPSSSLPTGALLTDIFLNPSSETLRISVSDRRDFYHQLRCTPAKAIRNTVGSLDVKDLVKFKAYEEYMRCQVGPYTRSRHGDFLGQPAPRKRGGTTPSQLQIGFRGILQGDHGGVEFATESHTALLQKFNVLSDSEKITSGRACTSRKCMQGLVIDDFFAISVEPNNSPPAESRAHLLHLQAQKAYQSEAILGSPSKDVIHADNAKVIGAYVDSRASTRRRGMVKIGYPPEKRYGLSWITLNVIQLQQITDSLHLSLLGGWVAALTFRRPMLGILNKAFLLVKEEHYDPKVPKILPLSRQICDELILLAVLHPMMCSNAGAKIPDGIYATDASLDKGAIVSTRIPENLFVAMFRTARNKGNYTRLMTAYERVTEDEPGYEEQTVPRPVVSKYGFIEIFAGAAVVSEEMKKLGFLVLTPVELSSSSEFDVEASYVIEWITHLIAQGRVEAFMVEPPCTTFSIMRRPQLRSKMQPYGFNVEDPQTRTGTVLAQRGLQCMEVGGRYYTPGLFETPFSSKLRYLPSWKDLEKKKPYVSQTRADSCRYGSPHMKPFRFLGVHTHMEGIDKRCRCKEEGRAHVKVQGQYTKASATYTPGLARALAEVLSNAILARREADLEEDYKVDGLEDQLVNEVMKSSTWKTEAVWSARPNTHINLLEIDSVCKLVTRISLGGGSTRLIAVVDSNVTKGAASKGRSSSNAITSYLRRLGSTLVSGDIQMVTPFCPTRLNRADDPTRSTAIRPAIPPMIDADWEEEDLYKLAEIRKLRRWASNWVALVVKVAGRQALRWSDRSQYRLPWASMRSTQSPMDFDQTLGFPGEGPQSLHLLLIFTALIFPQLGLVLSLMLLLLQWCSLGLARQPARPPFLVAWIYCSHLGAEAMPITARNQADRQRAALRTGRLPLSDQRHVTATTKTMRENLMLAFLSWTDEEKIPWKVMMDDCLSYIEEINSVLVSYGRLLHKHGRPYQHYAETINAVASQKMPIKRSLQAAWSLGFNWLQEEPSSHHVAMPFQVLMALLTTCLLWGWNNVGGILALGWGAFLRAGEAISAVRKQLLLPSDVGGSINFCLVSIMEPKTRHVAARHQAAKLDIPDLLQLVEVVFSKMEPHQRIWPHSGQTLRLRLKTLMQAIGLPTERTRSSKPLDLGSLRAGGATWALMMTEDAELIRRRGRWISAKTMEIYIQELTATTFLNSLDHKVKEKVLFLAQLFPYLLQQSVKYQKAGIAQNAWRFLFSQAGRVEGQDGKSGKENATANTADVSK